MTSGKPTSPPCQLKTEFLYNFCATCGRDEIDMDKCPRKKEGK